MARKPQSADRRVCAAPSSPSGTSGLTLVACGALARELLAITSQFPDDALDITCLPASWHNHPERIVPGLRRKVAALRRQGREVAVVYGDCGTGGEIDAFLSHSWHDEPVAKWERLSEWACIIRGVFLLLPEDFPIGL